MTSSATRRLVPAPMHQRSPDTRFPKGWYCIAESSDIEKDQLIPVSWLNEQFIVYRTPDGGIQAADAYCPHLGAHLASHDGCLNEGLITCPFHHWNFDAVSGACAGIPYSALPPTEVGLKLYPTRDVDGMVLIWYHPDGGEPEFEPFQSALANGEPWLLYETRQWTSTCPYRDMLENLFDTAHIVQLHRADAEAQITALQRTDYGLHIEYAADPDEMGLKAFHCDFSGISGLAQIFVGETFKTLFIISMTPVDNEHFIHKIRLYIHDSGSKEINEAVGKAFADRFVFEVEQDLAVLNFKKHLSKPRLCPGDGPIAQFRKYASEFYR